MIEEQGKVVTVEQDGVWVEIRRYSACSGCKAKAGCGQQLLQKHAAYQSTTNGTVNIKVPTDSPLHCGDRVTVGISEGGLVSAAAFTYLVPLLLMMLMLWLGEYLAWGDLGSLLLAIIGLGVGFWLIRLRQTWLQHHCRVHLLAVQSATIHTAR